MSGPNEGDHTIIYMPKSPRPARRQRRSGAYLTVAEFCEEMGIARSTFYDWRTKRLAPRCIKLPNGELRIRRAEVDRWLDDREEEAA